MKKKNLRFFSILFGLVFILSLYFVLALPGASTSPTFDLNTTLTYDKEGNFTVNWTAPVGGDPVVNYAIYVSVDGGLSWFDKVTNDSNVGYTFSNLTDANYTFLVASVNNTASNEINSSNVSMVVDLTNPAIVYGSGIGADNANVSQNWIFVNVTASDTNNDSATYLLFNSTSQVNSTLYTGYTTNTINWTGLPDETYTYNVTVNDSATNINITTTYTITLETANPAIVYGSGMGANNANLSQNWIFVNVTASDDNADDIIYLLFNSTGQVNSTIYAGYTTNTINWTNLSDGTYTYNVTINDTLSNSNITTTYTIILDTTDPTVSFGCTPSAVHPGGTVTCTCTGTDATSGVETTSYTASPSSSVSGSFLKTCDVTDYAGNSASGTDTYTVAQTSSGDGSGDGGTPSAPVKRIHSWTRITPGAAKIIKDFDAEIGIKQIQIEVNNEVQNVKMSVTKYGGKPAMVSKEKTGKVQKYLQIELENILDNLKKSIVTIQVEKSWVSGQSLDKENIALFKFNENKERWDELETSYKEESGTYYFYDIELTSFSYFAISEKIVLEPELFEDVNVTGNETGVGGETGDEEKSKVWLWVLIIVIVLAILFGPVWDHLKKKRK